MGSMYLAGLIENLSFDQALGQHMQHNLYPPPPAEMIEPAKAAIEAGNENDFDRLIDLPEGVVTYKGRLQAPAHALLDVLRLHAFLERNELELD